MDSIHPATRIGHVHLKVADLERALQFYVGVLGFELTQRYGAQAAPDSQAGAQMKPAVWGLLGSVGSGSTKAGAVAGMLVGFGLTLFYLINVKFLGMTPWFGIKDVSAGIFGIPLGFLTIIVVSLMTAEPSQETKDMVEDLRYPKLAR